MPCVLPSVESSRLSKTSNWARHADSQRHLGHFSTALRCVRPVSEVKAVRSLERPLSSLWLHPATPPQSLMNGGATLSSSQLPAGVGYPGFTHSNPSTHLSPPCATSKPLTPCHQSVCPLLRPLPLVASSSGLLSLVVFTIALEHATSVRLLCDPSLAQLAPSQTSGPRAVRERSASRTQHARGPGHAPLSPLSLSFAAGRNTREATPSLHPLFRRDHTQRGWNKRKAAACTLCFTR